MPSVLARCRCVLLAALVHPGCQASSDSTTPGSTAPLAREAETEALYWRVSPNSLAVDDEWIYFQVNLQVARVPKRAGEKDEVEQLGRLQIPEGSGRVVLNGRDHVYWASSEALQRNSRLYAYDKATGGVAEVDLGFSYLIMGADISDEHVVVFASDCLFAAVVDRRTLEVKLIERDAPISGSDDYAMTIHRDHLYCENESIVYQAPLAGGGFTELATMQGPLWALVGWGDYLIFVAGGENNGAGLIDLTTSPAKVTSVRSPFPTADSYGIYSEQDRTAYWLSRHSGKSQLILLDVDTWARAHIPMPSFVGPYNGIAQDEEYLYFGERDDSPTLLRTPKLTVAEVRQRFKTPDQSCANAPPYLTNSVCWEDPPIPGVAPGFTTPSNVPSGKPLLSATAESDTFPAEPSSDVPDASVVDAPANGG